MENILLFLGGIVAIIIVGFVAFLLAKGLWIAAKAIAGNLPDFIGKVGVSLAAAFVAGIIGHSLLGLSGGMSGGVALAGAAIGALFGRSA